MRIKIQRFNSNPSMTTVLLTPVKLGLTIKNSENSVLIFPEKLKKSILKTSILYFHDQS